jgi:hypothetical protein
MERASDDETAAVLPAAATERRHPHSQEAPSPQRLPPLHRGSGSQMNKNFHHPAKATLQRLQGSTRGLMRSRARHLIVMITAPAVREDAGSKTQPVIG